MDTEIKNPNSNSKIKPVTDNLDSEKGEEETEEEKDESRSLLPNQKGGILKNKSKKCLRKVQWNDKNGDNLVEVLEFQPSEASDTDDEDSDACFCTIL